jgi:hypothetical protein
MLVAKHHASGTRACTRIISNLRACPATRLIQKQPSATPRLPRRHQFFDLAKDWPSRMSEKKVLWTDNHSDIFSLLRWDQRPLKIVIIEPPPAAPASVPAKQ